MENGFRVQSVAIEGFKGFTNRQEIDLKGQHAFILGKNGNGKSSILEAIRWGLFGSPPRTSSVIENWDYPIRCRVEISMVRDNKLWNLRRTVLKGTTGGNDYRLTDANGVEHRLGEIMPQLDSVDSGEGMHIIFAPQSAPLRRQPDDLTTFERTVISHMGLTHPRSLLSQIGKFSEEQQVIENSIGAQVDEFQDVVDKKVEYLQRQRGLVIAAPPWDGDKIPSVAESENKVRALITEITRIEPDNSLDGVSLDALIDSTEESLSRRRTGDKESLDNELAEIVQKKNRLTELSEALESLTNIESQIKDSQAHLMEILGEITLDVLREKLAKLRETADSAAMKLLVVNQASLLLRRDQIESASCPVCEIEHDRENLLKALQVTAENLSGISVAEQIQLESQLNDAEEITEETKRLEVEFHDLDENAKIVKEGLESADPDALKDGAGVDELRSKIQQHEERQNSINKQIENHGGWVDSAQGRLSKLTEEAKYHKIQKDIIGLERVGNQLNQVTSAYQDLVSFGSSVQSIQDAVASCLVDRLEAEIPAVSEKLSRAYFALTHHPWYDRLTIPKETLPKLELRVASSLDPSGQSHPSAVLNGQSESALALVPYFAFSKSEDSPTEVYLVLLDDPTRAFDEDHIEILVEELAELGQHVQLVIASQESDKFRTLVPKYFDKGSYQIIEPTRWSHDAGPELTIE